MDKDIILWILGIIVTFIVGLWGAKVIKKSKVKQRQKTGSGSVAIQSGRDTNIENKDD